MQSPKLGGRAIIVAIPALTHTKPTVILRIRGYIGGVMDRNGTSWHANVLLGMHNYGDIYTHVCLMHLCSTPNPCGMKGRPLVDLREPPSIQKTTHYYQWYWETSWSTNQRATLLYPLIVLPPTNIPILNEPEHLYIRLAGRAGQIVQCLKMGRGSTWISEEKKA